jgi:hypothetical protein
LTERLLLASMLCIPPAMPSAIRHTVAHSDLSNFAICTYVQCSQQ